MRAARKEEGVKHVFIASGVRYDLAERSPAYVRSWPSTTWAASCRSRPSMCRPGCWRR